MRRCWIGVAVLGIAGCPPPQSTEVAAAPESWLDRMAPRPAAIEWTEVIAIDKIAAVQVQVRQEWTGPWYEDGREIWAVAETETIGDQERVRTRYQVFFGPEGYGHLGTEEGAGLERWDPVEVVLPNEAKIGQQWSAVHTKGEVSVQRSCELMASSLCAKGLVSVCDATTAETRTVTREHFCEGVGWAGYEALHVEGGRAQRRWSEELRRDGVPVIERKAR